MRSGRRRGAALRALLGAAVLVTGAAQAQAAGWTPARAVFAPSGLGVHGPAIAFSGDGSALAAWARTDIDWGEFQSAVLDPGAGSWGAVQNAAGAQDDWELNGIHLALDDHGNAAALWSDNHMSYSWIELGSRPASGAWTTPGPMADGPHESVGGLAMDPDGKAVGVWTVNAYGASGSIVARVRPLGAAWSAPVALSGPMDDVYYPSADVALDRSGRAVAVWARNVGDHSTVEASWRPAGGSWSAPQAVATTMGVTTVKVGIDSSGTATVLWQTQPTASSGTTDVVASRAPWGGGRWEPPAVLTGMAGGADSGIDLAVDPGGKAIAVWTAYGVATADVRPAGGAWAPRQALSDDGASYPVVSLNPAGDASAVWQRTTSDWTASVIEGSTRAQGTDWTPARALSSWGSVSEPAVAESPAGEGVAVWSSFDGRNSTVAWSAHDITPPALTLSLPVSAIARVAAPFSASASDRWSDVGTVTWDFGDGSTGAGSSIAHAYRAAGSYLVTASVTDAAGNTATRSGTILVAPSAHAPAPPSAPPTVGTAGGVTIGLPGATPATTPRPTPAGRRLPRLRIAVAVPRLRAGARGIATIRLNRALRGALVRVQLRRGLAYRTIASGRVSGRRIPLALSFSRPGRYLLRIRVTEARRPTVGRVVAVTVRRR